MVGAEFCVYHCSNCMPEVQPTVKYDSVDLLRKICYFDSCVFLQDVPMENVRYELKATSWLLNYNSVLDNAELMLSYLVRP